jgi:hypothetical protein
MMDEFSPQIFGVAMNARAAVEKNGAAGISDIKGKAGTGSGE